jgi:hypothetical protein
MHKGSDINRFGGTAGSFQPRSRLVQRAAIKLQQAEGCFDEQTQSTADAS